MRTWFVKGLVQEDRLVFQVVLITLYHKRTVGAYKQKPAYGVPSQTYIAGEAIHMYWLGSNLVALLTS